MYHFIIYFFVINLLLNTCRIRWSRKVSKNGSSQNNRDDLGNCKEGQSPRKMVWNPCIPMKVRFFVWEVCTPRTKMLREQ